PGAPARGRCRRAQGAHGEARGTARADARCAEGGARRGPAPLVRARGRVRRSAGARRARVRRPAREGHRGGRAPWPRPVAQLPHRRRLLVAPTRRPRRLTQFQEHSVAPIIEAHNLVKQYRKVRALDGLDLVAEEGRVVALLGPNGAGKTTFVRMLATLTEPT